jgi:hypothetical protein
MGGHLMLDRSSTPSFPRRQVASPGRTHGLIRPIYAGVFDIDPGEYEHTREIVQNWIRTHPTVSAFAGDLQSPNFELDRLRERDGVLAQAAANPAGTIFVGRLQHQETTRDGFDPARNWRTDVTVERDADAAWIAARIWFAGVASDERDCAPPRFIKDLWREKALSDLDILEPTCRHLEYEAEADNLAELILDGDRDLPVVVIADGCPLEPNRLASASIGLAHVFKISRTVRMRLLRALEFRYELNHGAIQTFFSRVAGAHPVAPGARFETVVGWRFGNLIGPAAFAKWLHEEMGRAVVLRLLNDTAHRTVESVKVVAIEAQRAILSQQNPDVGTLRTQVDLANEERDLLNLENRALERQMIELTARMERLSSERTTLDDDLRAERTRNYSLQQDKASLHYMLASKNGSDRITLDSQGVEALIRQQLTPATVFDAVDQAKSLFALYNAPVTVSDTALEAAMDCPFLRPEEVLSALVSLGFLWNEIKAASGLPLTDRVRERLGLWCAMRESEMTMNKFGEERTLHHDGREIVLEKHLTLGGGRQNATTTAQIYFGDKDGQVLIGHVGRHLNTVSTQ